MTLAAWIWTNRISGADQRILTVSTGTTANHVFGIRLTSSIVGVQHYDGSADAGENYSSIGLSGQWVHVVGVVASLSDRRVYVNATRGSAPYGGTQASPSGVDRVSVGYAPWGGTEYFDGQIAYPMIWNRALSAEDVWLLYRDTERLVRTGRRVYFFPSAAGGAVTHAATGSLTGPGSTVAGTAARERIHAATGALTGPGAAVAGTAARERIHAATGALTGPGATVSGSAERTGSAVTHDASGALTGPGAAVAGTAARERIHAATGALTGAGAAVAGTAARERIHAATGALQGPGAAVAGTSARAHLHEASGALSGPGATVEGTAARVPAVVSHDATGVLVGPGATLSADAVNGIVDAGGGGSSSKSRRQRELAARHQKQLLQDDEEILVSILVLLEAA